MSPIESGFIVLDRRPCFKLLSTHRPEKFGDGTDVLTCFSLPRLEMQTHNHPLDKTCLKRRNRQIQGNLHLVQPTALHHAQQTGLQSDDLLRVGRLGLIKACNRYDAQRGGKLSKLRQAAHSGSHPSFP